jgi:hypothetical protein
MMSTKDSSETVNQSPRTLRIVWPQWQRAGVESIRQFFSVGLHSWTEDDFPNIARWGIRSFRPEDLHLSSEPLLDWLKALECSGGLFLGIPFCAAG